MRYDPKQFEEKVLRFAFCSSLPGRERKIILVETVPSEYPDMSWSYPKYGHFASREELVMYLETIGASIDFYATAPDMWEFLMTGKVVKPGSYEELERTILR